MKPHWMWSTCGAAWLLLVCWTTGVTGVLHENETPATVNQADAPGMDETVTPGIDAKLSDGDIRDLYRIRRRTGNALIDDSLWGAPETGDNTDTEFVRELQREYGNSDHPIKLADDADMLTSSASPSRTGSDVQAIVFRQRSIRSLARRLDAIAQDMDDLRLFDQADELREMSHHLREEIRNPGWSQPADVGDE